MNLLRDPNFIGRFDPAVKGKLAYKVSLDGTVQAEQRMNVFPLEHWDFYYVDAPGIVAPEMTDAWLVRDPDRVKAGDKALKCHVGNRYHAGWMQSVDVPGHGPVTFFAETYNLWMFTNSDTYIDAASLTLENGVLTATAWMHAWSYQAGIPGFDPECAAARASVGVGCGPVAIREAEAEAWIQANIPNATKEMKDAVPNFTLAVGIDLTGGRNPLASHVVWGDRWHIYNGYAQQLTASVRISTPPAPEPPDSGWGYRSIDRGSRIGVHAIRENRVPDFTQHLVNHGTTFPVVKFVTDVGWVDKVMRVSPSTITIGRIANREWEGCPGVENASGPELVDMSHTLMSIILNATSPELRRKVDYWEISNEPDPPGADGYYRLGQLMGHCMDRAAEQGLKLGLLGLNSGTPEWDEMEALVASGMFAKAKHGGHILTLQEGALRTNNPKQWWGDSIPGAPEVQGAGALNFRYRYLYHLLKQHDQVVPLVISEWYNGDIDPQGSNPPVDLIVEALRWYDQQASRDYYVWGICPFTLGTGPNMWRERDWERFYTGGVLDFMIAQQDRANETPPGELAPPTDEGYDRRVLVVDYAFNPDPETREAAYKEAASRGITVGPSWNDARYRPPDAKTNTVEALGVPLGQQEAHRAYVHEMDPDAVVVFRGTPDDTPWDMDITDSLPRRHDLARWPDGRWAHRDLGVLTHVTNHHLGALIGDLRAHAAAYLRKEDGRPAYPYTFVIERDGTTKKCLHLDEGNWHDHSGKSHLHLCIGLNGALHKYPPTAEQLGAMVKLNAWAIRHPEMSITYSSTNRSRITGHEDWFATECPGWSQWASGHWKDRFYRHLDAEMGIAPPPPPLPTPQPTVTLNGMHDEPGGVWMQERGLRGCCLVLCQVQKTPRVFDFRHLRDQVVVARVNWGYADGSGSLPRPGDRQAWIDAVIQTINNSYGIDGWIIGNEDNNPSEWPGGYPNPTHIVSPHYYIDTYNPIAAMVSAPLAPTALDPYNVVAREFGQPGDPRDWAKSIYAGISRYDFIAMHAKTQTNDPAECWSNARFTHAPLTGRFLHLRTIEDQRQWIPQTRAIYVTEVNPQYGPGPGGLGWEPGNAEWVRQAMAYMRGQQVNGVMFYRYELAGGGQEAFALIDKPVLLKAIGDL